MHAGEFIALRRTIAERHAQWLTTGQKVAGWCLQASAGSSGPEETVQRLVAHANLAPLLGAPSSELELIRPAPHPYEVWLQNLWGRRCSYFISNLVHGLIQAAELQTNKPELAHLVAEFGALSKALSIRYERTFQLGITPEKSLLDRGDLVNFHVTYLDPILFSALYQLQKSRRNGHEMTTAATKILWDLIRCEVALATTAGRGKNENMVDVSTVWWGYVELVRAERAAFHLGEYSGWRHVVRVCRNLIHSNDGALRWPQPSETIYEATPEIYGLLRTRILVAMNCLNLAELLPPRYLSLLSEELDRFAAEQFIDIHNRTREVESHICWLGLALQLSATALKFQAKWERRAEYAPCLSGTSALQDAATFIPETEKFFIVKKAKSEYLPKPKGNQPLWVVEELRRQMEAFDIFVDLDVVWVKPEGLERKRLDLSPANRTLLMLFLRYGPIEMESANLYQKIIGAEALKAKSSNPQTQRSNLAAEVARLRKKLGESLVKSVFDVPDKARGKEDRGYSCSGTYSCCMILPRDAEATLQVKTLAGSRF